MSAPGGDSARPPARPVPGGLIMRRAGDSGGAPQLANGRPNSGLNTTAVPAPPQLQQPSTEPRSYQTGAQPPYSDTRQPPPGGALMYHQQQRIQQSPSSNVSRVNQAPASMPGVVSSSFPQSSDNARPSHTAMRQPPLTYQVPPPRGIQPHLNPMQLPSSGKQPIQGVQGQPQLQQQQQKQSPHVATNPRSALQPSMPRPPPQAPPSTQQHPQQTPPSYQPAPAQTHPQRPPPQSFPSQQQQQPIMHSIQGPRGAPVHQALPSQQQPLMQAQPAPRGAPQPQRYGPPRYGQQPSGPSYGAPPQGPPPPGPSLPPPPTSAAVQQPLNGSMPPGSYPGVAEYPPQGIPQQYPAGYPQSAGYPQPAGAPQMQRRPSDQRVPPDQIPRPDWSDSAVTLRTCTPEGLADFPHATRRFIALDEGNASPRFMRSTLRSMPISHDIIKQTNIPLAVDVVPMAEPVEGEEPIAVVDFGEGGPPRCRICKAYMNSYAKFISQGDQWRCNFCAALNEVAHPYRMPLDGAGLRLDRGQRPELCRGTVDFRVPSNYCIRPIQEPIVVFCIDVSAFAYTSGFTRTCLLAVEAAMDAISSGPGGNRAKIGVLGYDRALHFCKVAGDAPNIYTAVDVESPFAPIPAEQWVLPLTERGKLQSVLRLLFSIAVGNGSSRPQQNGSSVSVVDGACASVAVLHAASQALSVLGGHVILIATSPPTIGAGAIQRRDDSAMYGTDKERTLYQAAVEPPGPYTDVVLGGFCAERQICLGAVLVSESGNSFFDVGTLGPAMKATGGKLAYVVGDLAAEETRRQVLSQVVSISTSYTAFETVLKLRCSVGLICTSYLSTGIVRVEGELENAALGPNHSILCTLEHDGTRLKEGEQAYIQAAVLYSSRTGERLVRCHTLALPITGTLTKVYQGADVEAIAATLVRTSAQKALEQKFSVQQVVTTGVSRATSILTQYRKLMAPESLPSKLVLPESLRLLPLYTLCMQKCVALRGNPLARAVARHTLIRPDERACELLKLCSAPAALVINTIYPPVYSLALLADASEDAGPSVCRIAAASEQLSGDGAFLLDAGSDLILYVGHSAPAVLIDDLFGPSESSNPRTQLSHLSGEGPLCQRLKGLLQHVRASSPKALKIALANSGTAEEVRFTSLLVEDQTKDGVSYVEHLVSTHLAIIDKAS